MFQTTIFSLPATPLLRSYVAAIVAAGAAAAALAGFAGTGAGDLSLMFGLIVAGATSERFKVGLFGDSHVSLGAVASMAAGLIGGPRDAVVVASCVAVAANLGGAVPLYKTLFNMAVYVIASLAYLGLFRLFGLALSTDWPWIVLPATLAAAAYFVVNTVLVAVAVSLASDRRIKDVVREKYLWLVPHYLPLGTLAAALASGYAIVGPSAILIFVIPMGSIQVALFQYSAARMTNQRRLREVEERILAVEADLAQAIRMENAPHPHVA